MQQSTFSNGRHLVKGPHRDHPRQIWFNEIQLQQFQRRFKLFFYQNMPNLHNWYKSDERKISHKNQEYMYVLNYS